MTSVELRGLGALVTEASKGSDTVANELHVKDATVLATTRTAPSLPEGIQFVVADLGSVEGCGVDRRDVERLVDFVPFLHALFAHLQ